MSDTTDEGAPRIRELVDDSNSNSLRDQMQAFLAEHGEPADLEELRERVGSGEDLSDIVVEGREERI